MALCPLMALRVIRGMSAIWSLTDQERTLVGIGADWIGHDCGDAAMGDFHNQIGELWTLLLRL